MMIVRAARPSEVDAAVEVWKAANADRRLLQHPRHLETWAGRS